MQSDHIQAKASSCDNTLLLGKQRYNKGKQSSTSSHSDRIKASYMGRGHLGDSVGRHDCYLVAGQIISWEDTATHCVFRGGQKWPAQLGIWAQREHR